MKGDDEMITLMTLMIISVLVLGVALAIFSIGGTIFTIIGADLIVAIGILWLVFTLLFRKRKEK